MVHSRVASVVIVILGLLLSFSVSNINDIWGWVAMGISAGLLIPQLFRWYWWRFNGYGYAIGTGAGILAAIISRIVGGNIPEYYSFIIASVSSLSGCLIGTYLTPKTDPAVLVNFYNQTRPFGLWKNVSRLLPDKSRLRINRENKRDMVSTLIAIGWQLSLFMGGMMLIMKRWNNFFILLSVFCVFSIILYFNWYRHLSDEVILEDHRGSE